MANGALSLADVTSPRKSAVHGDFPPTSSWPEVSAGSAPGQAVSVEVMGSEEGRIDPATGAWQRNEGKGSRHVRYVLQVSAHGQTIVVRRRWRQIVAFSDELQKLSKGWIEPQHPEDRWSESNKIKSSWRNPGFNEKKIAVRRETLSAFFKAFSAWATRLATQGDQRVDFFEANVHKRLKNIKEFLVGPDSLENDPPTLDSPMPDAGEYGAITSGSAGNTQAAALVDASVEIGDWQPSGSTQAASTLAAVEEEKGEAESVAEPEPVAEPQVALVSNLVSNELDMTVEADNVRSI